MTELVVIVLVSWSIWGYRKFMEWPTAKTNGGAILTVLICGPVIWSGIAAVALRDVLLKVVGGK